MNDRIEFGTRSSPFHCITGSRPVANDFFDLVQVLLDCRVSRPPAPPPFSGMKAKGICALESFAGLGGLSAMAMASLARLPGRRGVCCWRDTDLSISVVTNRKAINRA